MPDLLWLTAVLAQLFLLLGYLKHRMFLWWAASLLPGIVFSPIIAALPDGSWAKWNSYVVYQVIRSVLTIAAVLEARDAMTSDESTKRFARNLGVVVALAWAGYRFFTTPGGLCDVVLTAVGSISAALFGTMLAVLVWKRVVDWPLKWPASVHLPLLLLLMAATIGRSRFTLWCVAAIQAVAATMLLKYKRPAV